MFGLESELDSCPAGRGWDDEIIHDLHVTLACHDIGRFNVSAWQVRNTFVHFEEDEDLQLGFSSLCRCVL